MGIEQAKAEREMRVFHEFIKAAHLDYDLRTAENRTPPKPDIGNVDGYVAFELFEICDQDSIKALAKLSSDENKYIRIGGASIEAIRKKRSRVYETDYPIELVCYTRASILPGKVLMEQIKPYFFKAKGFRTVWFFDEEVCQPIGPA